MHLSIIVLTGQKTSIGLVSEHMNIKGRHI